MTPFWLTIFLDLPAARHDAGTRFWLAATGYGLSATRGDHDEFATLVPPVGDAHLKLQRTDGATPGVHLDLHVADLDGAVAHAVALGAELVARPGHAVLRSPAGFVFCLVGEERAEATPPADWGTHRSRVDQLTIDVAPDAWDAEAAFWSGLTGWPVHRGSSPEFARLGTPSELPVRILLQRLDEGETHGHVDIATDDRGQEVERLTARGADQTRWHEHWTVMTGPDGSTFCVTERRPDTGLR
ncbi:VOC family protein [Nocardioides sp. CER19]|uniref:VOC family protein n=1 Tax=Nocardioides sp. CER19 TaxID=3038538 RepID=UPI00244A457F|nr:VOC family protein [Nocardioides sp. CER19]MDH2415215.1 VOC family protein [Nocardioides sp. CER19]